MQKSQSHLIIIASLQLSHHIPHWPEKVKPDLKSKGGKGAEEHDANCKVEDDQEELCLLTVALEVSPAREYVFLYFYIHLLLQKAFSSMGHTIPYHTWFDGEGQGVSWKGM